MATTKAPIDRPMGKITVELIDYYGDLHNYGIIEYGEYVDYVHYSGTKQEVLAFLVAMLKPEARA